MRDLSGGCSWDTSVPTVSCQTYLDSYFSVPSVRFGSVSPVSTQRPFWSDRGPTSGWTSVEVENLEGTVLGHSREITTSIKLTQNGGRRVTVHHHLDIP